MNIHKPKTLGGKAAMVAPAALLLSGCAGTGNNPTQQKIDNGIAPFSQATSAELAEKTTDYMENILPNTSTCRAGIKAVDNMMLDMSPQDAQTVNTHLGNYHIALDGFADNHIAFENTKNGEPLSYTAKSARAALEQFQDKMGREGAEDLAKCHLEFSQDRILQMIKEQGKKGGFTPEDLAEKMMQGDMRQVVAIFNKFADGYNIFGIDDTKRVKEILTEIIGDAYKSM